jgi:hypothetical protein
VQESGDVGWKALVLSRIAREDGLSGQHLEKAAQVTLEGDFAWGAACLRFPATELSQQLHLDPVKADAQVKAKGQIPPQEQASSASKDTMIAALQKRVREQAAEIEQLKKQVEVAYGLLAIQRKES